MLCCEKSCAHWVAVGAQRSYMYLWWIFLRFSENLVEQECIPVGCVPSTAVAVSRAGWGGAWVGGVPGPGGCTWSGGRGCTWSRGGVPGPRGCTWSLGDGVPGQVLPPPCGQTDACKNITFATSLRTVINACGSIWVGAPSEEPWIRHRVLCKVN